VSVGIIDCCSLLSLFTGWGSLENLRPLPYTWNVCEAVLSESEFTREYGSDGNATEVPLDVQALIESGLLNMVRPDTDAELGDYVAFATEIDDGEAQALALAKHRRYILLTDDRKATKMAQRADVQVVTMTTVGILREWHEHTEVDRAVLREVIQRIQVLARFSPRKDSVDLQWWLTHLRD
jgi:predicted nucleic acid-binding protein